MERLRLDDGHKSSAGGKYFKAPPALAFIPTGCTLLDCAIGGGWPLGRIANVVGDKSTGKTLLAIEACANFAATFPKGRIKYREVESAFDIPYAATLGLPTKRVDFGKDVVETVEDFETDLKEFAASLPKGVPGMYVLDSLDPLSDNAEMDAATDAKGYGTAKAKMMSRLFRKLTRKLARHQVFLLIISQVRDKIGVAYGRATTRAGGRALDFYASQVIYLAQVGRIMKTRSGIKRAVGVDVLAKVDKCKVGPPFREAEFPVVFGFGMDDVTSSVVWLKLVGRLKDAGLRSSPKKLKRYLSRVGKMSTDEYNEERQRLAKVVRVVWDEVDEGFLPKRKKYQ